MFGRKEKACEDCGYKLEKGWEFCPRCGASLKSDAESPFSFRAKNPFSSSSLLNFGLNGLMKNFQKQFGDIEKSFQTGLEGPQIRTQGFTINIASDGSGQPRIKIQKLGEQPVEVSPKGEKRISAEREKLERTCAPPKCTIEPETNVRKERGKTFYEIKLPDVHEKDIDIQQIGNSLEIRARSGDRLYFKILGLPANKSFFKSFEKNKLVVEV